MQKKTETTTYKIGLVSNISVQTSSCPKEAEAYSKNIPMSLILPKIRKDMKQQNLKQQYYRHIALINRKITVLLNMQKKAADILNENDIIENIIDDGMRLFNPRVASFYRYDRRSNSLELVYTRKNPKNGAISSQKIDLNEYDFLDGIMNGSSRKQGMVNTMKRPPCFDRNIRYYIFLPIINSDRRIGAIYLGYRKYSPLSTQDLGFCDLYMLQSTVLLSRHLGPIYHKSSEIDKLNLKGSEIYYYGNR